MIHTKSSEKEKNGRRCHSICFWCLPKNICYHIFFRKFLRFSAGRLSRSRLVCVCVCVRFCSPFTATFRKSPHILIAEQPIVSNMHYAIFSRSRCGGAIPSAFVAPKWSRDQTEKKKETLWKTSASRARAVKSCCMRQAASPFRFSCSGSLCYRRAAAAFFPVLFDTENSRHFSAVIVSHSGEINLWSSSGCGQKTPVLRVWCSVE